MVYVNEELRDKFKNNSTRRISNNSSLKKTRVKSRRPAAKASAHNIVLFGHNLTVIGQITLLLGFFVILATSAYLILKQPISNWYLIKHSNPAMIKLAEDAGMSKQGELIFLRTKPQIDTDSQFQNDCSTTAINNTGNSEVGCYDPSTNRIYILSMPQSLYDEEVTTAAYEMLHPVYISLYQRDGNSLNQAIEANFSTISTNSSLCTDDIPGQVASFSKSEPGERDNELFSLLGTECSNLSPSLASYYSPYFSNISADVTDNQQIDNLFQDDENQLNQLNTTINQDENDANTAYNDSVSWANVGNQAEDDYNYNIYIQDYNAANDAIDQFNAIANTYNELVTAITGGQPVNEIQNVQSQSSQ